ncbi:MAG TPA: extracellular solute-binding protein, partial [Acidimicrobiales bacterium]|nr:extracellular solute-binding protein [Acidimicrobiales bacterium]
PATVDASWQFIKFLASPQSQATWASGTGYVPIRKSAVNLAPLAATWAAQPGFKVAYKQLLASPPNPATAGSVTGAAPELLVAINNALTTLASGGSPESAIAQAAQNSNTAISSYNERV